MESTEAVAPRFGFTLAKKLNDIYLTPVEEHKYTIIWMHGLGDSSEGFLDFFYSSNPIVPNKVRFHEVMMIAHKSSVAIST